MRKISKEHEEGEESIQKGHLTEECLKIYICFRLFVPPESEKSIQSCCSPKTADKLFFDHNLNMSDDNITCVKHIL